MSFVPDNRSGNWSVETFEVPKNDPTQIFSIMKSGRGVPPGTYKRLMRGGTVVMSNTPDELFDFHKVQHLAHGSVLINGLGLGCLVRVLLNKSEVTQITVIEKSEDVIALVKPYLVDSRLTIIQADAFSFQPPKGARYDFVWHDIWDYICSDNLKQMAILHRKYARRSGWQDSWARAICKQQDQRWKKQERAYQSFSGMYQ
ncbi:hypothetical protein EQG79_00875 [Spirosoma sordidisoli]|uniref:Class I SAM-dependent methyltransferase n=2 Tax=Spirosoma sordidisoli TaxID=2502893 RepID=A0A4Q2UV01_9BACT|nr:hypothetical protein EQG79_00875 [Spirosoma sordidisoli]